MGKTIVQFCGSSIIGGTEIATATLVGALDPALPIVIAGSDPEVVGRIAAARPAAPTAVVPRIAGKSDVRGWASLTRAIAELRPRIFQLNSGGGGAGQHALLIATLLPGVRTVVVDHAASDVHNGVQRRIRAFTAGRLSAHIAPSRATAAAVETIAGLAAGSVRTIPNGVPDVRLRSVPRVAGGVIVGSIGRLQAEKRFDLLIRAVAELPGVVLVLVGDGPERRALEELASELGVGDRVHFVGWLPHARARDYLTSFDVFALPSRLESFSLVLLEAGLAGLPVVACRVGGIPEVVADGESGLLVEPNDLPGLVNALLTLINAPDLRESFGARGRLRALAFSPDEMARRYETLYRKLASA